MKWFSNRLSKNRLNLPLQRIAVGMFFGVLAASMGGAHAYATTGINQQINYQARLLNTAGATVPDGSYNLEFKIYSGGTGCVSGGTSPCGGTLLWTEDWLNNSSQGVTVTNGYFSVMLGAGSDSVVLDSINFNQTPLWLSINIGNTGSSGTFSGDGEMLPFTQFAAAPYAFNSEAVGGVAASSLAQLAATQTFTGANMLQPTTNITGLTVAQTSAASPTADIFDLQTANGTKILQATGPSTNNSVVTLQAVGTGNALNLDSSATVNVGATNATSLVIGNTANNTSTVFKQKSSVTALQVLPISGSTAILDVDSTNNRIGLNTNAPGAILDVEDQNTYTGAATNVLTVVGGTGATGNISSNLGGAISLTAGTGGARTTGTGSAGGGITITGGTGGAGGSTSNGGAGGNITINGGTGGTGGNSNGATGTVQLQSAGGLTTLGGNLTLNGSASVITGPGISGLTLNNSGNLTVSTTTTGIISISSVTSSSFTSQGSISIDAGTVLGTLSLNTSNNRNITTGTGLFTQGGNLTFSGSTARTITGPGAGGLTITDATGALTLTGGAASTWDIGNNTLSVQTTGGGAITTGTGTVTLGGALSVTSSTTLGGNVTFSGSAARTITGPSGGLTIDASGALNYGNTNATSLTFGNTANTTSTTFKQASSSTAFQVQNASSQPLLTVDTSANQVVLGLSNGASGVTGKLAFSNSGNNNKVTIASGASSAAYNLLLPVAAPSLGSCLQNDNTTIGQLTFASCGTGGSGVTTVGTFSGSSQTNGASISSTTITFGPADASNPGMVSTGTQAFAGAKTFNSSVTLGTTSVAGSILFQDGTSNNRAVTLNTAGLGASYTLTLPNSAPGTGLCLQSDATTASQLVFGSCAGAGGGVTTVGTFSGSSQTNGASISGSTITFGPADATNPGLVSTGAQTFGGAKTINNGSNTSAALTVTQSANPTSTLILATNTNASPTGNLIDLQSGSGTPTSQFSVSASGLVTAAGNFKVASGNGLTSAGSVSISSSGSNAVNIDTGSGGDINIAPSNAADVKVGKPFILTDAGNAFQDAQAPTASATQSIINLGASLSGGSSSGTYIGVNAANGYTGDLVNLQVNNSSKFVITAAGDLKLGNGVIVNTTSGAPSNYNNATLPATAADLLLNRYITTSQTSAFTLTMPTAAAIVAAIPRPAVGDTFTWVLANGGTGKVTPGLSAGVTISPNLTGASAAASVTYLCRLTNVTGGSEAVTCY